MTALLVDAADVEHGDLIAGQRVAAILLDCADGRTWEYRDTAGTVIATAPVGGRVEVVRGEYIEPDPAPPRGITRRHGLYVVVP